uniref:Uncharacterized protein n=1 Tax=Haplochromis burtoni TaxID=8153 RepID=A0A3Q2V0F0_HAPBU
MFENSIAQQQSPQTSRPGPSSTRRAAAMTNSNPGSSCVDSPSSGGQQRLKNAINLGKAVGAKVNDLLRRKEPSNLGDIGVTEVNKNVGFILLSAEAACKLWMAFVRQSFIHHITSFDSFPRLDPPPPSGKKRLPRALKTTQDMMISSDPVVSSPDPVDSSINDNVDTVIGMDEHGLQLQLSVPDLINKDPPLESKAKQCDIWQKAPGPDSRLASTPCSGKTPCRISLGEDVLLGNGAPCSKATGGSTEDMEHHPDLLSFE